jgi:hypothetical protein
MNMSDGKQKPQDVYLKGIKSNEVQPGQLIKGIKGSGERADVSRRGADAFKESARALRERE